MRIAQLSPLWESVPPPAYGGTEAVVSLLTEGLVSRGHEVTLFASGDSKTTAGLRCIVPISLRSNPEIEDPAPYEWTNIVLALQDANSFDIIHNHAGEIAMLCANLITTPMLTTCHGPLAPDKAIIWENYPGHFNTISRSAKLLMPDRHYSGVVYNAVDVDSFPYRETKDDYLLFLGRMSREKGPHLAIQVARRLGKKLLLAGKIDPYWDGDYFSKELEPQIDGEQIIFVGEADATSKRKLFAGAQCLLMPIEWEEPFGLVMVEAMACGTPVVAFDRGSVREVILDHTTGYIVRDLDEMVARVGEIGAITPRACRDHVRNAFHIDRMVEGYLALYQRILDKGRMA
jgi:glycosyltransferase involved in cell wall biosynthesis